MKRIIVLFIVCVIYCSGCQQRNDSGSEILQEINDEKINSIKQVDSEQNISVDDVTMVINNYENIITMEMKDITVDIINNSGDTISVGYNYKVQHFNKNVWEDVPLSVSYEDILYDIDHGNKKGFVCSLEGIQFYQGGEYRIVKTTYTEQETYDLSVDFHVK